MSTDPRELIRRLVRDSVDLGEKRWKDVSICRESGCGCITEYIEGAVVEALAPLADVVELLH